MTYYAAARTNLSSHDIRIGPRKIGEGEFREVLEGTYVGGNRNNQNAVCKRFKPRYRHLSNSYFQNDFKIIDLTILCAQAWNRTCPSGLEILVNKGAIHHSNSGIAYLVEPEIRYFVKFTSNSGWIGDTRLKDVRVMAAFSHFTYHISNGAMIVCDLQGRYRNNGRKSRFELTDPAICSISRKFGATDLGRQGIESFFANYEANEFTDRSWEKPYAPQAHFRRTMGTTFLFR